VSAAQRSGSVIANFPEMGGRCQSKILHVSFPKYDSCNSGMSLWLGPDCEVFGRTAVDRKLARWLFFLFLIPEFVLVDRDRLADRLSPPIRCASGTYLVLLIAYMCPCSLEINISSSSFLHFWRGYSGESQDFAWAACSVPRKADQAATNSEFRWMQGPGTECGLFIGFDAFLLSF